MDPYVIMTCRNSKFRTKTKDGAGKTPAWPDEHFTFKVHYIGDDIEIVVKDEDVGSDDTVGSFRTKLSSFCIGSGIEEWYKIEHKGKSAG